MKKLQKISINPEKVIKNDELVNLRGGYNDFIWTFTCTCLVYPFEWFDIEVFSWEELKDAADALCGASNYECTPC